MTVEEPILLLSSTSDPNIRRTLETFRSLPDQVLELSKEEAEIRQSIIRLIGEEDALYDPGTRGGTAFGRYLRGDSVASVQRFREEILGTTPADYEAFADSFRAGLSGAPFVVLGRRARLEAAAEKLGLRIFVP
jgi:Zn-dependent M16 (insulinase) family peptidase